MRGLHDQQRELNPLTTTGSTGITIWAAGDTASIHGASAAQEASLRNRIVATFGDVTARDAAYTGLTGAQKAGIICWIVNRGAHCYFDFTSNNWQWLSVHRKVAGGIRASAANSASIVGGQIIPCAAVTLPPGNRLLHITASSVVTNLSTTGTNTGRAYVTGLGDGDNWLQVSLAPAQQSSVSRQWYEVKSGTVQYELWGLQSTGDASGVRFANSWIQVFDLGACDD